MTSQEKFTKQIEIFEKDDSNIIKAWYRFSDSQKIHAIMRADILMTVQNEGRNVTTYKKLAEKYFISLGRIRDLSNELLKLKKEAAE